HFWDWSPERNLTTGAIRLTDYNFKKPDQAMEADRLGDAAHAQGQIESFDYPGDYPAQDVGKLVAGLRTSQERGADRRNRAVGDCASLRAGRRVTLAGDPVPGTGETYLCLSASHHFVSEAYGSGGSGSDGYAFTGSYALMPDTAPMVPPRRTAVPVVHGPQTAMVVGEGEIDCDEFGRILVRFHWDLAGAHSMRCRVSQNWAGAGWGGMVIPRIGMEVVVEFLEGDPDKPIVTGCVYNGRNQVPYPLPANKTVSTFKSDTHQGDGYNELRFEDEKGEEEVFIHAQRDMNSKVERNASARINRNSVTSIGHDQSCEVGNTLRQMIGGDMHLGVGPGRIGSVAPASAANNTQGIGPLAEAMGDVGSDPGIGNLILAVEATKTQMIEVDHNETVGRDKMTDVRGNYTLDVGRRIEITAGDSITIKVGASLVTLDDSGNITVNGSRMAVTMNQVFEAMSDLIKLN
ncbi:type VI secretion system Vgr family protein, partial [Paracoccus simplex]